MKPPTLGEVVAILCIIAVLAYLLLPAGHSKGSAIKTACISNLKQLSTANVIYFADNDDRFPNRDSWRDAIAPHVKSDRPLICPIILKKKNPQIFGYAVNRILSNARYPVRPEVTIHLFESNNLSRNASGDLSSLPKPGRHLFPSDSHGLNNVVYAGGHAKGLRAE